MRAMLLVMSATTLFVSSMPLLGDEAAGPVEPLHQIIDREIAKGYSAKNITPAGLASDEEFLRRIHIDLTGTIPTTTVAREFLADGTPDKRQRVIDRLLNSPAYAYHMQRVFDVMLLERQHANYITVEEWHKYLRTSFGTDKPWDQFIAELLATDGTDPNTRPAIRYLLVRTIDSYRVLEPHMISRDVSRLLLGQNMQCARCHDHPSIDDYLQADYYGIFGYFQWAAISTTKIGEESKYVIVEQPRRTAIYTSVFKKDQPEQMAQLQLPGSEPFVLPAIESGKEYIEKPEEGKIPIPVFSPRARLATDLRSNPAFRRNIVNRLWANMLGLGIVHPIDLHHAGNAPSHPELLDQLAERFAADGFLLKPFFREIALSETYQRSSIPPTPGQQLPPETFAQGAVRMMSPEQLGVALMEATGLNNSQRVSLKDPADETPLLDFQNANLKPFVDLYGRPMGQPEHDYDSSLFQALFLANGSTVLDWIKPRPTSLAERLNSLATPEAISDELYLSVYTRKPTTEETAAVAEYLQDRMADRADALQELIWASLAAVEFRFNH